MKKLKNVMSNWQIALLANETIEWLVMTLVQYERFKTAYENHTYQMTKGETQHGIYLPEKMLLIHSIYHFFEGMYNLSDQISKKHDTLPTDLIGFVPDEKYAKKLTNLRNMNEHKYEYVTGNGHRKNEFSYDIDAEGFRVHTNALISFGLIDKDKTWLGDIEITDLVGRIRDGKEKALKCLEEIMLKYAIMD